MNLYLLAGGILTRASAGDARSCLRAIGRDRVAYTFALGWELRWGGQAVTRRA
jgi:hypothetical protein